MSALKLMKAAAIAFTAISHGALASDDLGWPIVTSPMMELLPLPDEAFDTPVAFCRGVLFMAQLGKQIPKAASLAITASNGRAVCWQDGRAEIIREGRLEPLSK